MALCISGFLFFPPAPQHCRPNSPAPSAPRRLACSPTRRTCPSKVQSVSSVRLPVLSSPRGQTHSPFPLMFFFKFLERIPIVRVHLLRLFIGGIFGTPRHVKFHKRSFFVHCKIKGSLFSPLSAKESCLDEVPIPGERTRRRRKRPSSSVGFYLVPTACSTGWPGITQTI